MGRVTARPMALRHYATTFALEDARLRDRAHGLADVLQRYASASELASNRSHLAEQVRARGDEGTRLAGMAQRVAVAFERLDAGAWTDPGGRSGPTRHVGRAAFASVYERLTSAWSEVHHLGDLVMPLDEQRWFELLWAHRCPPPVAGGHYAGGGGLVGPDGRIYPLVIPELEVNGQRANLTYEHVATIDPATLGGQDTGWVEVDRRVGVARVIDEVGIVSKVAAGLGVAAGLSPPRHQWASSDTLARVVLTPEGRPQIDAMPRRLPRDPRQGPGPPPARWGRNSRRVDAVDLVTGAVEGAELATRLDDPGANVYRVVFEEHEGGGRRARMYTHQLVTTEHGSSFVTMMAHGVDGQLRRRPATVASSGAQPMSAAPRGSDRDRRAGAVGPRDPAAG